MFIKDYNFGWGSLIVLKEEFIEATHLWDGELNLPLLSEGDILLIDELDLEVIIKRRLLSTTGEYIYETDHVELIEDEWTEESRTVAEEKLQEHEKQLEEFRKKQEEHFAQVEAEKGKRTWLEKLFGNQ